MTRLDMIKSSIYSRIGNAKILRLSLVPWFLKSMLLHKLPTELSLKACISMLSFFFSLVIVLFCFSFNRFLKTQMFIWRRGKDPLKENTFSESYPQRNRFIWYGIKYLLIFIEIDALKEFFV